MKKIQIILLALILTACTTPPTLAPTAIPTSTLSATATATLTPMPTETPTPEAKKFEVCTLEEAVDGGCSVTGDELMNGGYRKWLEEKFSEPFDQDKIQKDIPLIMYKMDSEYIQIIYSRDNAPYFTGNKKGTEPFDRDFTFAFCTYEEVDYVVMPIKYYDQNNPDKPQFVITVQAFPRFWGFTKDDMLGKLGVWQNDMNITVIVPNAINPDDEGKSIDPLVSKTFKKYPDMEQRFLNFVNNNSFKSGGDMSALSKDGMIFLNEIRFVTSGTQIYK
jgi:hypothetical protein